MANDIYKNPRSRFLHAGAFVSVGAAVLALVFAGGMKPWSDDNGEIRAQSQAQPAEDRGAMAPFPAPLEPDLDDPVVVRVHNPEFANDIAVQVAMDQHIAAALGSSPGRDVSVVLASEWLSDQELNELNQVRASFGEPPLRVVDVW